MRSPFIFLLVILVFVGPMHAVPGQETRENPPADEEKPDYSKLPKPLDSVQVNAEELEKDGFFQIVGAQFGYIGDTQEEGLIWTIQARREMTYRHALLFLGNLRDARFYYQSKKTKRRVSIHTTVLEFPSSLQAAATRGKHVRIGEKIEVWIPLAPTEKRRVIGEQANLLELRRPLK